MIPRPYINNFFSSDDEDQDHLNVAENLPEVSTVSLMKNVS
jgi:hypothetical protein